MLATGSKEVRRLRRINPWAFERPLGGDRCKSMTQLKMSQHEASGLVPQGTTSARAKMLAADGGGACRASEKVTRS